MIANQVEGTHRGTQTHPSPDVRGKTEEPPPGSCNDKRCMGPKAVTPHPAGLTPMFSPLPFLSQDSLAGIAGFGQPRG